MCLEADRRVGMLDRTGRSNDLFRFSTTKMQWEQLDAPQVKGSPLGSRSAHVMVTVGSDLYVFGGYAGVSSQATQDFVRFSTTEQRWEQLDARQVSGSPLIAPERFDMVAVGSHIYVFADDLTGDCEEGRCAADRVWVHAR